jgi:hypothetical protein
MFNVFFLELGAVESNKVIQMMSMIVCKTMIYIWKMMLVQTIILLMMQLFQSSKLMTIILQWQKAAENQNIIEKTAWGNESSMNYFLMENQNKCAGIQSVVSNATKHYELTSSDVDYHLLGTLMCNNLPHERIRLLESFLIETLLTVQKKKLIMLSHHGIRRCYTKRTKSIYMNMPVPLAIVGGEAFGNFAFVSVENAVNHLLCHDIPLKMLKLNKSSDWKNSNECFHTLFHKELYKKPQKLEHLPENLRIHLLYIWSDGFWKNTLVKTKKHLCNSLLFMLCHLMVYKTLQDTL